MVETELNGSSTVVHAHIPSDRNIENRKSIKKEYSNKDNDDNDDGMKMTMKIIRNKTML